MSIGFCISSRLGSSRLPRKHLLEAGGRPFEEWLIRRILAAFADEIAAGEAHVVLATTPEPEDQAFKMFEHLGVTVFTGSRTNIPLRHHQAAQALGLSAIVAVDGDDILCAIESMRAVYEGLRQGKPGVKTQGLPIGMNTWGYQAKLLQHTIVGHEDAILETGWGRIFDFSCFDTISMSIRGNKDNLRYTLDYPEDSDLFRLIIEHLGMAVENATAQEIVDCTLTQGYERLNSWRSTEYMRHFHEEQHQEAQTSTRRG